MRTCLVVKLFMKDMKPIYLYILNCVLCALDIIENLDDLTGIYLLKRY